MNEKKTVAYHVVGPALVAACQSHSAPVHKITTVLRTSGAPGYTMQMDQAERFLMSQDEAFNKTAACAAEKQIFNSITAGAANDIEHATRLERAIITRYGMSDQFGMVSLETVTNRYLGGDVSLACSRETVKIIHEEVVKMVGMAYGKAIDILKEHEQKLHEIAKYLLEKETIAG